MCLTPQQPQNPASAAGVPPAIPLADAKANELKGDKPTMGRMGDKLQSVKSEEYWDKIYTRAQKQKVLDQAVNQFEKQKRKEMGLE